MPSFYQFLVCCLLTTIRLYQKLHHCFLRSTRKTILYQTLTSHCLPILIILHETSVLSLATIKLSLRDLIHGLPFPPLSSFWTVRILFLPSENWSSYSKESFVVLTSRCEIFCYHISLVLGSYKGNNGMEFRPLPCHIFQSIALWELRSTAK